MEARSQLRHRPTCWRVNQFSRRGEVSVKPLTGTLVRCNELDADGGGDFEGISGGGEVAGFGVDGEGYDVPGFLVGYEEAGAGGVDLEVTGGLALGGDVLDRGQLARFRIYGEDCDAVMAAIGGVDEFAIGEDFDFGGVVLSGGAGGEGGDSLHGVHGSGFGIEVQGVDGG